MARASLLEWAVSEFSGLVRQAEDQIREKIPKGARMKESLNHRDLHGVATLPYSRFMLSLMGIIRYQCHCELSNLNCQAHIHNFKISFQR